MGQNHGRTTAMFRGALICVVDFDRIMAAATQPAHLIVGQVADQLTQLGIFAKEFLADICASLGLERLIVAIDALFHAFEQKPGVVPFEERVPVRTPDHLDYVPPRATENAFQFIDDPAVAAHRSIKAVKVAVDNEYKVVQPLEGGDGEGAARVHFISFTVTDVGPNLTRSLLNEIAGLQIPHKTRLVNRIQRTDAHRDRGESPKVWHQPWVRVGRKAGSVTQIVTEVEKVLVLEATFQIGTCVDSRGGVSLKVDEVPWLIVIARVEEVVKAHL